MSQHKQYETICVFVPDLQGERRASFEEKITRIFSTHKVENVTKNDWGIRKLAYPIKNFKTATYVQYLYQGTGEMIRDLERNLGYEESVLRFLTVRHDKHTPKNVAVEPAGFDTYDM